MQIRFLSKNKHKIDEATSILQPLCIRIVPVTIPIDELQSSDVKAIVRDKVLRAYGKVGHKLFVEHTCLYLDALRGFPGGLTQSFWDALEADRFSELFGQGDRCGITAKTLIGYCDGRRIHHFEGEIRGKASSEPRGNRDFQWDCVFIPDGYDETFSEMGNEKKNEISMRRIALNQFADHLRETADV